MARRLTLRYHGIALLELVIALPLLVLLVFGLIEYGWIFLNAQYVTNAARHGARVAARADSTAGDVAAAIDTAMGNAGLGGSGYATAYPDPGGLGRGETISVSVSVPYPNIELTGIPVLPVPAVIRGSVSMAKEGP